MAADVLTITVSAITAAVAGPIGAWVNSRILKSKYQVEVDTLRADMEQKLSSVETTELENVRMASQILMTDIVKPLEKEIKSLRRDVDKFRRAIEKIPACPSAPSCPVQYELRKSEEGDGEAPGGDTHLS